MGQRVVAQLVSESLRNNCTFNKAREYLLILLISSSTSSIALISYDRYLHMTRIQNYGQFMSKRKVAVLITVGWALPAVMGALPGLITNILKYAQIALAVYFSLCFLGIVVFYSYIVKFIRKMEKDMADNQAQDKIQKRRISNEIRVSKVAASILACFLITVIPGAISAYVFGIEAFHKGIVGLKETSIESFCRTVVMTLAMANSAINPFVYYLRDPKFRKSLLKGMKRVCPLSCRSNRLDSETGSGLGV